MKKHDRDELLPVLKARFAKHMHRHRGLEWTDLQARLVGHPTALKVIGEMERTGGEPDVIGHDPSVRFIFCDRRFGWVFVHHDGAPSYCAARGFRGLLRA